MMTLNRTLAIAALLAGTALTPVPAHAQDQSGGGAMDQSQGMDQGNSEELLLRNQNQATPGEDATMPDADTEGQAETDQATDPAIEREDRATSDELLGDGNRTEEQATEPRTEPETDDVAREPSRRSDQDQTATDRERRRDQNAVEDTASDKRSKKTDDTTAAEGTKSDRNRDQASEKPSAETTGSVDISAEQKTVIKNTIIETNVKPVKVDFDVSIGVAVPRTIVLHPLPARVVEIVPAYRDYVYFVLADGRIVIVDPDSYEIVYILVV